MHAASYHREAKEELEGKVPVKGRWTDIESSNPAMFEAKLIAESFEGNINVELVKMMDGRSLEFIKSGRKSDNHKQMVQDFRNSAATDTIGNIQGSAKIIVKLPPIAESPKMDDSLNIIDLEHAEDQGHEEPVTAAANPEERREVEEDFNMNESTEVYISVETYLHSLNSNTHLGTPTMNRAFGLVEENAAAAKNLVVAF